MALVSRPRTARDRTQPVHMPRVRAAASRDSAATAVARSGSNLDLFMVDSKRPPGAAQTKVSSACWSAAIGCGGRLNLGDGCAGGHVTAVSGSADDLAWDSADGRR